RDQQSVAVGRRLGDEVGGEAAAGAGAVLDDDRLAERAADRLAQRARDVVGGAAGSEADDQADRPGRGPRLRLRAAGAEDAEHERAAGRERTTPGARIRSGARHAVS